MIVDYPDWGTWGADTSNPLYFREWPDFGDDTQISGDPSPQRDGVPRPEVASPSTSSLPSGSSGMMLYNNGSSWVTLAAPSAGAVLRHNGTAPYWAKPVDCS